MTEAFDRLRGRLPADRYSARDLMRGARNVPCGALPLMEALRLRPDTVASLAHEIGMGPEPRRGMSNIARQTGETFDETLFSDGRPLIDAFVRDGYVADHEVHVVNVTDHVDPSRRRDGVPGHGA